MKKIVLIGLLCAASHVFAESAAKVLSTDKKVVAKHNGAERTLSRGASLNVGDEIDTSDNASINLQYSNGTLVNLGANTTYKILAYAPKSDIQIKAELSNGKLELQNPGKIKETLKTPIVSLAILGTHINVDVTSSKMTYVQVIEGLVLARTEFIRPGDSVRVTGDRILSAPFPTAASTGGNIVAATNSALIANTQITGTTVVSAADVNGAATLGLSCNSSF